MLWGWLAAALLLSCAYADYPDDLQACPEDCDCHYFRVNYVTDCSESNLTEIPYDELSPNVYILDMNGNEISEVDSSKFPEDVKIRRLQLAENLLTEVKSEMFAGLKYMLDVDLSSNLITTIESDAFKDSVGLITIELQNNPLKRINAGPFISSRTLIYLDISNCSLSHLNDEFFNEVPFLTTLYLSGNPLTDISLRLLSSLTTLEELKLSQCNLTHLNPEFLQDMIHLKLLDLSRNRFKEVDWGSIFSGLARLETLNLERSGLRGLPADVFSNNTWLRNVDLSNNDFSDTDIGTTLGDNLKNLHHLDLSSCNINSLDRNSFSIAEKLKTLDLSNNDLLPRELLTALIPIKKLTHLSLRNCSLPRLPKQIFENLTELRDLDISWNPLNNVFEELLQPLQHLEFLNMGYSNLQKLAKNTFSQTTNLKKLILSGNKLGELESGLFKDLTKLECLEMNHCGLGSPLDQDVFFNETYTELQELRIAGNPLKIHEGPLIPEQLSKIKVLDLSNCSLKVLPENIFDTVRNITHLYLSNNHLDDSSMGKNFLKNLTHLEYLDLSGNRLTRLSVKFVSGTNLRDIKFTNNPWLCDCNIVDWWNWAKSKGDVNHLVGATLTQEDISKGGNKRKKGLLCSVDPSKTPILPRNSTKKTRVEATVKTWARYLKESACRVLNFTETPTTHLPVLFPEPILPSPGPAMLTHFPDGENDQNDAPSYQDKTSEVHQFPAAIVGAVSAVVVAFIAVLGVYLRRRSQNTARMDLE